MKASETDEREVVMSGVVNITQNNFEETVISNPKPVLVDFWATWCPPCKMIAPWLEDIASEFEGRAVVCKVDVDGNPELASRYGVRSVPTLIYFKGGEIREQVVGALPKEQLKSKLNELINEG